MILAGMNWEEAERLCERVWSDLNEKGFSISIIARRYPNNYQLLVSATWLKYNRHFEWMSESDYTHSIDGLQVRNLEAQGTGSGT